MLSLLYCREYSGGDLINGRYEHLVPVQCWAAAGQDRPGIKPVVIDSEPPAPPQEECTGDIRRSDCDIAGSSSRLLHRQADPYAAFNGGCHNLNLTMVQSSAFEILYTVMSPNLDMVIMQWLVQDF